MDCRASKFQTTAQKLYLPVIFLLYGLALGSVYWKTQRGILLMSCYQVFACASQLFMASVIHNHLHKALPLFCHERSEGVGKSYEFVMHVFIRISAASLIPLLICCGIIYLCTIVHMEIFKFLLTAIIHIQLNHAWIAIIIFVACTTPRYSTLICPLLSAVSGFAGGFLVPKPQMPDMYYWLFYINPTHWAYGGMMKMLLNDVMFDCDERAPLECRSSAGIVILEQFGFQEINPYQNMIILFGMLMLLLFVSIISVELKYSHRTKISVTSALKRAYERVSRICGSIAVWFRKHSIKATREEKRKLVSHADLENPNSSFVHNNNSKISTKNGSNGTAVNQTLDQESSRYNCTDLKINKDKTVQLENGVQLDSVKTSPKPTHNSDATGELLSLPVIVKPMLTGRIRKGTRPNTVSGLPERNTDRQVTISRSKTFNFPTKFTLDCETYKMKSLESNKQHGQNSIDHQQIIKIIVQDVDSGSVRLSNSSDTSTNRDSGVPSKYIDVVPKPHKVFCSLSSAKNVRKKKNSSGKVNKVGKTARRQESVHLQRQASMLILEEKRKSMSAQLVGFGNTFGYGHEPWRKVNRTPSNVRRTAMYGAKRKIEAKKNFLRPNSAGEDFERPYEKRLSNHSRDSRESGGTNDDNMDQNDLSDLEFNEFVLALKNDYRNEMEELEGSDAASELCSLITSTFRDDEDNDDRKLDKRKSDRSDDVFSDNPDIVEAGVYEYDSGNLVLSSSSDDNQSPSTRVHSFEPVNKGLGNKTNISRTEVEPVQVSSLKIPRKKSLVNVVKPEANIFEGEYLPSLSRTPLGSIDELDEISEEDDAENLNEKLKPELDPKHKTSFVTIRVHHNVEPESTNAIQNGIRYSFAEKDGEETSNKCENAGHKPTVTNINNSVYQKGRYRSLTNTYSKLFKYRKSVKEHVDEINSKSKDKTDRSDETIL